MSVLLQPYQVLQFSLSVDFQVSRSEGGSLCSYNNLIDQGTFVPFAILSPDPIVGEINLYDCDDVFIQTLSLDIISDYNIDTGLWFHYYNGDDLGISCGTYYISILIGDYIWYSEQFTLRDIVNTSQYPELIKDNYHLPLRIYDNIIKQLINKTDIGCDVQPLNPVSTIMPFMFDTDEDINSLDVFLVNTCTDEEIDLSADLELEFIKTNPGTIEEQEILTTSQQLRNTYYNFSSQNFVYQEIKVNDTGKLKDITFEWLFNNEAQTVTISLIQGTNVGVLPFSTKTITDNAVLSKEITINYESDNINVIAGTTYIIQFSSDAECSTGIGINSVKVYADGRFAERNYIPQIKGYSIATLNGTYENHVGNYYYKYATFNITTSINTCYAEDEAPIGPLTYSYKYTAKENNPIRLSLSNFKYRIKNELLKEDVIGYLIVKINTTVVYIDAFIIPNIDIILPSINNYYYLNDGDVLYVSFYLVIPDDYDLSARADNKLLLGDISISQYNYGAVPGESVYYPSGEKPLGVNYQNKSLWFYVNITKEIYIGGTGATQIYNPGRPLPSPLTCGNYYLKLVSNLHTWYSEWFRIINVGAIDLTTYVLGTEGGEIIITEDETSIITLES